MTTESTRKTMLKFFKSKLSDPSLLAEDVVFTLVRTGQVYRGREAVLGMLDELYRVAFDANPVPHVLLFGDQHAMLEADFVGRHIGTYAGIPATQREIHLPMCVVYDLAEGLITRARVYYDSSRIVAQLLSSIE